MKLAYWFGRNIRYLRGDRGILFEIVTNYSGNFTVYGCSKYNIVTKINEFKDLDKAILACEDAAMSEGFRVLTSAEMNLL